MARLYRSGRCTACTCETENGICQISREASKLQSSNIYSCVWRGETARLVGKDETIPGVGEVKLRGRNAIEQAEDVEACLGRSISVFGTVAVVSTLTQVIPRSQSAGSELTDVGRD